MRIVLFLLLFIPFVVIGQINQTDANGLRQGLWQKKQANGKLIYEGSFKNGKPVGEWKRYHEGGRVKAILNYDSKSDSARARLFDEWGNKVAEGNYLDEQKAGTWVYYRENRKIGDEFYINGSKHGIARKYYETGEVWESVEWQNGKQEGKFQVFFKSGEPFFQCKMSNNQRNGLCLTYFQNGKVELEANYKNGLHHGEWKYFDENGKYRYSLKYDEGKLLNPEVRDSIGNLQIKNMEKNRDKMVDPEKYLEDPSECMRKMNVYK